MGKSTLEVRRDIERIRAELDETLDDLGDHVRPSRIAERRTRRIRGRLVDARERVMGSASDATSGANQGLHRAGGQVAGVTSDLAGKAKGAPDVVAEGTRGNPLVAGLVSFGIGVLIGSLPPATEAEKHAADALSDTLEPVKQKAMESAQSVRGDVEGAAREAAEHVKGDAQQAAQEVKGTAQESASQVKDQAQSGAQAVRETAQPR
jgi:hypothetical protein